MTLLLLSGVPAGVPGGGGKLTTRGWLPPVAVVGNADCPQHGLAIELHHTIPQTDTNCNAIKAFKRSD